MAVDESSLPSGIRDAKKGRTKSFGDLTRDFVTSSSKAVEIDRDVESTTRCSYCKPA
jgi:hypothetical protein